MLGALAYASSPFLLSYVLQVCAEMEDVCVFRSSDTLPKTAEAVRLVAAFTPDIVFLELEPRPDVLETIAGIWAYHPEVAIVGLTNSTDDDRQIEVDGSRIDVLNPCTSGEEFYAAITKGLDARRTAAPDVVTAFLPSKAGNGASTLALNVAIRISRMWQERVCYLECDLHSGPAAIHLNIQPVRSTVDILDNAHLLCDETWPNMVFPKHGVDFITCYHAPVRRVSEWSYRRLLPFVRKRYGSIICDLPEVVNPATRAIVQQAKQIFLVCAPDLSSLFLTRKRLIQLRAEGASSDKIYVVLNQFAPDRLSVQDVREFLGLPVAAVVPYDADSVWKAASQDGIVPESTGIEAACDHLAQMIVGRPHGMNVRPAGLTAKLKEFWKKPAPSPGRSPA